MRFDPTPKFRRALVLPALALLSLLAACTEGPGGPIPYNRPLGAPDAPTIVSLESDYRIAPADTVSVKVFKAPDMSGDYDVDDDHPVITLNEGAFAQLRCEKQLVVVPGATHLFEEPGALDEVARVAREWFERHLSPGASRV